AKQNSAETSGATSGARVAAYLRGDGDVKPSTEKILERFTAPLEMAETAKVQVATPNPTEAATGKKLEALTKPTESAEEKKAPAPEPAKPADLSKANEKLSSLLGNSKKQK
ncbi:MAG: ABC transporter ATP-binding protein, partial [Verrucomicrobiota bacterium]